MADAWFITGIGSGIGRAVTERLLGAGVRVAGTVRRPDAGADLRATYGDLLWTAELDVRDDAGVQRAVREAFSAVPDIGVVLSNAGYGLFGAAEELSDAQVADLVDTNLLGTIRVARAAPPFLRAHGGGRMLVMSSVGGATANAGGSVYSASKWGVEGFAEALAEEVAPFGVGVTIVEPGGVRTGFLAGLRLGEPLAAYDGTPAAAVRGLRTATRQPAGDPERIADAVIASTERSPAPLRLVLGRTSHAAIVAALQRRLTDVTPQADSAAAADSRPA